MSDYWNSYYASSHVARQGFVARAGLKVITPPTDEPLTLAEAARHLRIEEVGGSPTEYVDQAWLLAAIPVARELCESLSGLTIARTTLEIGLSAFPCHWGWGWSKHGISLLTGPVLGILSVSYDDGSGTIQTVDDYVLDDYIRPPELYPAYNASWPTVIGSPNSVKIRFNAGYTTEGESPNDMPLPSALRHAMLLMLGHLYENREGVAAGGVGGTLLHEIPLGITSLLEHHRLRLGMA